MGYFTQNGNTDVVHFQVQNHSQNTTGELQKLHGHRVLDTVNTGNTVTDGQNRSGLADVQLFLIILNLLGNNLTYFLCPDRIHVLYSLP